MRSLAPNKINRNKRNRKNIRNKRTIQIMRNKRISPKLMCIYGRRRKMKKKMSVRWTIVMLMGLDQFEVGITMKMF
jgi:hypothetical protein